MQWSCQISLQRIRQLRQVSSRPLLQSVRVRARVSSHPRASLARLLIRVNWHAAMQLRGALVGPPTRGWSFEKCVESHILLVHCVSFV